jgi:hypothetical protein
MCAGNLNCCVTLEDGTDANPGRLEEFVDRIDEATTEDATLAETETEEDEDEKEDLLCDVFDTGPRPTSCSIVR